MIHIVYTVVDTTTASGKRWCAITASRKEGDLHRTLQHLQSSRGFLEVTHIIYVG